MGELFDIEMKNDKQMGHFPIWVYRALLFLVSHVVNRCSFHGDMVSPSVGAMVTVAVNKGSHWLRAT